jgi:hypothetical protein
MTALWMMWLIAENNPDLLWPFCFACALLSLGLMGFMYLCGKVEPILLKEKVRMEHWWAHRERQKRLKYHLNKMCEDERVAALRGGLQMAESETQEGGLSLAEKGSLRLRE